METGEKGIERLIFEVVSLLEKDEEKSKVLHLLLRLQILIYIQLKGHNMDKQINKVMKKEEAAKSSLKSGIKATDKLVKMDKFQDKKLDMKKKK